MLKFKLWYFIALPIFLSFLIKEEISFKNNSDFVSCNSEGKKNSELWNINTENKKVRNKLRNLIWVFFCNSESISCIIIYFYCNNKIRIYIFNVHKNILLHIVSCPVNCTVSSQVCFIVYVQLFWVSCLYLWLALFVS